jgi:hypothetical protein
MGIEPMSLEEAKELFGDDFDPESPEDMSEDEILQTLQDMYEEDSDEDFDDDMFDDFYDLDDI